MLLSSRLDRYNTFQHFFGNLIQFCGINCPPFTNDSQFHLSITLWQTTTNLSGLEQQFIISYDSEGWLGSSVIWCLPGAGMAGSSNMATLSWLAVGVGVGGAGTCRGSHCRSLVLLCVVFPCELSMRLELLTAWQLNSRNSFIYSWLHHLKMSFKN